MRLARIFANPLVDDGPPDEVAGDLIKPCCSRTSARFLDTFAALGPADGCQRIHDLSC